MTPGIVHLVERFELRESEKVLRVRTRDDHVDARPGLGELRAIDGKHVVELLVRVSKVKNNELAL